MRLNTVFSEMNKKEMESSLQKRLKRIDRIGNEFGSLTPFDHILLLLVGIAIPIMVMLWGWIG